MFSWTCKSEMSAHQGPMHHRPIARLSLNPLPKYEIRRGSLENFDHVLDMVWKLASEMPSCQQYSSFRISRFSVGIDHESGKGRQSLGSPLQTTARKRTFSTTSCSLMPIVMIGDQLWCYSRCMLTHQTRPLSIHCCNHPQANSFPSSHLWIQP